MKMIVVLTHARSGSTALSSILSSIRHSHFRGENAGAIPQLVKAVQKAEEAMGHANQPPWQGASEIQLSTLEHRVEEAIIHDLLNVPPEALVAGFKEIRFSPEEYPDDALFQWCLAFQRIFPDTLFIFNTRPALGALKSMISNNRAKWWPQDCSLENVEARIALLKQTCHDLKETGQQAEHFAYPEWRRQPSFFRSFFDRHGLPYDERKFTGALNHQHEH